MVSIASWIALGAIKEKRNRLFRYAFISIIIGGALGNFFDRILYKAVPDFVDLHYNNFHWFTFNVADIFITIGILVFIIRGFYLFHFLLYILI